MKRLTPSYILRHILLSDDTWRCLIGIVLAIVLAPVLLPYDRTGLGRYIMFIGVVVVGWAVTKAPSRWIVARLRGVLPDR
jgi:hypothetical protein